MPDLDLKRKRALNKLEAAFKNLEEFVETTTCDWCAEKGKALSEAMKQLKTAQTSIYDVSKQVKDITKEKEEGIPTESNVLNPLRDVLGGLGKLGSYTTKKKEILEKCFSMNENQNLTILGRCLIAMDKSL